MANIGEEPSPDAGSLSEAEQRVVLALRHARLTERAPDALRARIESSRPRPLVRARRRVSYGFASAALAAVLVLALVLALPGGTPGAPSLSQAAALASRGATAPAPGSEPGEYGVRLGRNVGGVYFPDWSGRFGWRASGQRADRIGGRAAVTIYYDGHGRRVAYTIVAAPALATPRAVVTVLNGTRLSTLMLAGREIVTWRRANHTCVVSGAGVPVAVLRRLAAWRAPVS